MNKYFFIILILFSTHYLSAQNLVTHIPPEKTKTSKIDTLITTLDATTNYKHIIILENDITIQDGYLIANKKTGKWFTYSSNGILLSFSEYENGMKNGIYLECDKNGAVVVQELYKNDRLEGEQKKYVSVKNVRILKGSYAYKNGVYHGTCTEYNEMGLPQSQAQYTLGKRDGFAKWYFSSGKLAMEQTYINDILTGPQKIFGQTGNLLSEGNFNNNLKTGLWTEYYDNGKMKSQGSFAKDAKTGAWKYYDESGNLNKTESF